MSSRNDPTYRLLKWTAIVCGIVWLAFEISRQIAGMSPAATAYAAGNKLFSDGQYERAAQQYRETLTHAPEHHAAMLSLANSYVQLGRYGAALDAAEKAIRTRPDFGGAYATRGIVLDHLGEYDKAMADYARALKLDPAVAEGMPWFDRLLYNVQETPATIAGRLAYLQKQMALPEAERVLKMPEADARQRPYER